MILSLSFLLILLVTFKTLPYFIKKINSTRKSAPIFAKKTDKPIVFIKEEISFDKTKENINNLESKVKQLENKLKFSENKISHYEFLLNQNLIFISDIIVNLKVGHEQKDHKIYDLMNCINIIFVENQKSFKETQLLLEKFKSNYSSYTPTLEDSENKYCNFIKISELLLHLIKETSLLSENQFQNISTLIEKILLNSHLKDIKEQKIEQSMKSLYRMKQSVESLLMKSSQFRVTENLKKVVGEYQYEDPNYEHIVTSQEDTKRDSDRVLTSEDVVFF
jgi:hypothetical protein